MRVAHSAVVALLAVGAVPSVGAAQVLDLNPGGRRFSFDHKVPVATVSLVGDIVALDGARLVEDPYGEPFVLGNATLDVSVPYLARIVFTMTNPTATPILLKDVIVYGRTMMPAQYLRGINVGAPYTPMNASGMRAGYPGANEELAPGASVTVEYSIPSPSYGKDGKAAGFIVFVGRDVPHGDPPTKVWGQAWAGENPLFTRAFLKLLSQPQR